MTPKTVAQYIEIREDRKKQLMDIGLELFANEGYHNTTISRIAAMAGISKGLMYNYFESKEDLLIQLAERGINSLLVHFDPDRDGVLTRDEMIFLVNMLFQILTDNPTTWKLYFSVMMQPDVYRIIGERFRSMQVSYLDMLTSYFREMGRKDPYAEARFLMAVFDGIYLNYVINPAGFPLDELKQLIINRIIVGE
jgi:AcrR family transcriptional regulator